MKESEFRKQGLGIRTKGQDQGSRIGHGVSIKFLPLCRYSCSFTLQASLCAAACRRKGILNALFDYSS